MSYTMIVCIVPNNSGDLITDAVRGNCGGGTILMGRGTCGNSVMHLLGLGDTSKEITCNIVTDDAEQNVMTTIRSTVTKKTHFGVMFSISLDCLARSGFQADTFQGEDAMDNRHNYQMINVIVNKGYAEDVMAAARKTGANGGTVIGARGTAKEDDARFFGVTLVPEKELVMILIERDKADAVMKAICTLSCLAEKGSGIMFSIPVKDFEQLGN